ncbi:MAG TPA: hypothetical protein VGE45_03425 [Chloroflexia bacterium]|jgi:hypothetical protein
MPRLSIETEVVRVLSILRFCGEPNKQLTFLTEDYYTHAISSQLKLQKVDFWLRYPDHFAMALMHGCRQGGELVHRRDEIKDIVRRIFFNREPQLRCVPMRRYIHGAYEPLDTVLSFLSSRWLAYHRAMEGGRRTEYRLTQKGCDAIESILAQCPLSIWYAERCRLINSFYGDLGGEDLRELQYVEPAYRNTSVLSTIPRIESAVRARFQQLYGEPL